MGILVTGTAGEVGFALTVNFGGWAAAPSSVASFEASPIVNGQATPISVGPTQMTLSSDGTQATYFWTGTDFTIGGPWNVWVTVDEPNGNVHIVTGQIFVKYPPPVPA